jgi:prophage regulatory protein
MYRKMRNGTFPRNIKISTRCTGWRESAITEWRESPIFYSADDSLPG